MLHCLVENDSGYEQYDKAAKYNKESKSGKKKRKSIRRRNRQAGARGGGGVTDFNEGQSLLEHLKNITGGGSDDDQHQQHKHNERLAKGRVSSKDKNESSSPHSLPSSTSMQNTPIRIVMFSDFVISFQMAGLPSIARLRAVLGRIYQNNLPSTGWLVHALFDAVVHSFRLRVESSCHAVDQTDTLIHSLSHAGSAQQAKLLLQRLAWMGRRLGFLRQRLWSKRDLLLSLMERDWQIFISGVNIPYLRDVHDHIVTSLYKIEAHIEIHSALQTSYLSSMSIDVAHKAHKANVIMTKLTSVATIILPLSLVTSVMGMNCTVPFQNEEEPNFIDLIPFLVFCALMACLAHFLYLFFKHRNVL